MPQFALLALAGTALYAGYRVAAKIIESEAVRAKAAETARRRPDAAGSPKDLGALEWDEASGVYRPRG